MNNHEAKIQKKKETQRNEPSFGDYFIPGEIFQLYRDGWEAEKLSKVFNKLIRQGDENDSLGPAKEGNILKVPKLWGLILDPALFRSSPEKQNQ